MSFRIRDDEEWRTVSAAELFGGKTVVVFSLPGAFTPTCSASHVPRYDELAPTFRSLGVDAILCVSVNDTFVMNAWRQEQGTRHVTFVPDGNGAFTEQMGMLVDKDDLGFGKRSWRYSMLVRDGLIEKMFIEPDVAGDPYEVSDADTMLRHLAQDARVPPDILVFSRANCAHCKRAKAALDEAGLAYEEVVSTPRMLKAVSSDARTPQVFIDGKHIGGADALEGWLRATL